MTHTTVKCFWLRSYTACHAWDLWRVLYLPTRQCSCSPSAWDYQPTETRHLRSFYQTFCQPAAQMWTRLTAKIWEKCSSWSSKFMTSMKWTSAWLIADMVSSKAYAVDEWCIYRVAQLKWGQLILFLVTFGCIGKIQWLLAHINYIQQEVVWCKLCHNKHLTR